MPDSSKPPKPMGNDGTVFRCPMCRKLLPNINIPSFPFCCDRCRLLDLNNWLEGKYATSRPIDPTDELEDLRKTPQRPPDSED